MADTVDQLVVKIKADLSQLRGQLKDIEKSTGRAGKRGGNNLGALGTGAIIATTNLRQANKNLEETANKSRIAGLEINNLTKALGLLGAAFVGVQAVGVLARVGMEFEDLKDSLDQVFGSIQAGDEALDKVFTFAQTTPFQIEDATKAFIALKSAGLEPNMKMLQTFSDTASVSVDQLGTFEALVRMVQRSASGGMGLEELNMISDRGIDVLGILSDKLNLGKDDIAKFGKTAEGAAKMVKALTEGLQERFGGAMEAKMDNLSTKASNMTIAFKQLGDEVFKSGLGDFLKDMADSLTSFANAIGLAIRESQGRRTISDFISLTTEDAQKGAFGGAVPMVGFGQKVVERDKTLQEQLNELKQLRDSEQARLDILKLSVHPTRVSLQLNEQILDVTKDVTELNRIIPELEKRVTEEKNRQALADLGITELTKEQITARDELLKLLSKTTPEMERLNNLSKNLEELSILKDKDGKPIFSEEQLTALRAYIAELKRLEENSGKTEDGITQMQQAIVNMSSAFTSDFVDALLSGQNALTSFKDFAKNIVNQIITIMLQMEVVNRILAGIFPNLGIEYGGVFSPLEKASGGRVQNRPYLVGERGPELFVPDSSGLIMNNMNTKNALSGGQGVVINQSINFATGVQATVRNEVLQLMPQIADVTKAAVSQSAERSLRYKGSFA